MKFAEHLSAHITPEWRKQYIRYEELKAMLYQAVERAPSAEVVEQDLLIRYFTKFDEQFFHVCYKELEKINTFYSEKLAEATRKFATLSSELREALQDVQDTATAKPATTGAKTMTLPSRRRNAPRRKLHELKLAFSEYYLSLVLLQNYQNLNFTGFRKILKKHDKLLSVDTGSKWHEEHVEMSHFYVNKDISKLIHETEGSVTRELEGGDRARAMKRLRVPPLGEQQNSVWTTFKVGFFAGALAVLMVAVVISCLYLGASLSSDWRVPMRLYRSPFLLVQFMFLWSVNVYGWRCSGVNHVLIFELDPRCHLSEQHIMEIATVFGVVWTLSVLSFLYSPTLGMPAYVHPFVLYLIMFGFLLNPFKILRYEARFWALKIMARVFLSPMFHVNFADFWVADQINSILPMFVDLQYFICYYINLKSWSEPNDVSVCVDDSLVIRSVMAALPAWFRFAQCLRRYRDTGEANPHLANAIKYSTTFLVVMFAALSLKHAEKNESKSTNPWFYLWIISSIISSSYTYVWDIKLDWGLFDEKPGDHKFLREEIVYPYTWTYYFGIVEDLVLRFGWVISMCFTELGFVQAELMLTLISPWEVFRRFIWNYFRLENEHLNNCGKFRAVRDISVAPLDSSDQQAILKMMDHRDGVINRYSATKGSVHHHHHHGHHNSHRRVMSIMARPQIRILLRGESADHVS